MSETEPTVAECECYWTPPETWLSAASCGYGSGYEPGSQMEWNPDCPAHPPWDGTRELRDHQPHADHGAGHRQAGGRRMSESEDAASALDWLTRVHDARSSAERLDIVRDRLAAADAALGRVVALARQVDVYHPARFEFGAEANYVAGYHAARSDLRAALTPTEDET